MDAVRPDPLTSVGRSGPPRYGGRAGYGFFYVLLRCGGVVPAYLMLALVVPYYLLVRGSARRSAAPYLRRRFPADGRLRRGCRALRYFYNFGQALLDQAAIGMLGKDKVELDFPQWRQALDAFESGKGVVLVNSHVGLWQAVMGGMGCYSGKLRYYFQSEPGGASDVYYKLAGHLDNVTLVSPDAFLGGVVELANALLRGDCVGVSGDRPGGGKTIHASFLGAPAAFPVLPYHLALSAEAHLFMVVALRVGKLKYRMELVDLRSGVNLEGLSKPEAVAALLGRYVRELEAIVEARPYDWFNFFDFWGIRA